MSKQSVAHYIDLPGAAGNDLEFAPRRWSRRALFGTMSAMCQVAGEEFELDELSVSHITIRPGSAEQNALLDSVDADLKAQLLVNGQEVFTGAVSIEKNPQDKRRVSLRLMDSALDVEAIRTKSVRPRLRDKLRIATTEQALVPSRYAELCGRFAHLLRSLREVHKEEESAINCPQEREQIVRDTEEAMFEAFHELWVEASATTRPLARIDPRFMAIKRFTEAMICPELMDGPMWQRAYKKPLGYPGDFRVMEYAYERFSKTGTLYGDAIDRIIANRMGGCVRERMAYTRDRIIEKLEQAPAGSEPLRIASIGAGSAREIDDFVQMSVDRPLEMTLVEQDQEALQHVYERSYSRFANRPGGATLKTLNASFIDLLRNGRLYTGFEPQDAIYSLGLIDYFNQPTAKRVARGFYDRLKPGGTLILCNMRDFEESAFWPLEFLCDWRLEYRNESDMLDLADGLGASAVDLAVEPTGLVWMLSITKPA